MISSSDATKTAEVPDEVASRQAVRLEVVVPQDQLTAGILTGLFRGIELMLVFRALSADDVSAAEAKRSYASYINMNLAFALDQTGRPYGSNGANQLAPFEMPRVSARNVFTTHPGRLWSTFEQWDRRGCDVDLTLDLLEINRGSYEFVFQLVNLSAIFFLQDFAVLKDSIQWFCGSVSQMIDKLHREPYSFLTPKLESRLGTSIELTGTTLAALHTFDEVFLEEKHTERELVFRMHFKRNPSNSITKPLLKAPSPWSAHEERRQQRLRERLRQARARRKSTPASGAAGTEQEP